MLASCQNSFTAFCPSQPNVGAKNFVAAHVKTPTAAALVKEMAAVHSPPASALTGTEGAAVAVGVEMNVAPTQLEHYAALTAVATAAAAAPQP